MDVIRDEVTSSLTSTEREDTTGIASGEKQKASDIIAAIETLKTIETERRPATAAERQCLARFAGFGAVARSLFPDPLTGHYKDAGWQALGEQLSALLTPDEYASAKRTTFNAFYTSPLVVESVFGALRRLGVPDDVHTLEPGCGTGNFLAGAPAAMRFTGVELDTLSGRIARALHPRQDIRIENFRDSRLPEGSVDCVVGNVPFADITLEHKGQKLSLHDYFFAKAVDALKPGGVLALVTSRYTLDKQNTTARAYLARQADFMGAIRLPEEAFKDQGTRVVTDIVFLRKRAPGAPEAHAGDWLQTATTPVDGKPVSMNAYFAAHPEMVLGTLSLGHGLYGREDLRVRATPDYRARLAAAISRLPRAVFSAPRSVTATAAGSVETKAPAAIPAGLGEGAYFVGRDRTIRQIEGGDAVPVTHGATVLKADGTLMGRRLADLIGLRDQAREVLRSQNEAWPEARREEARRALERLYDRFVAAYGPINKTTFSATAEGGEIRRMPNLVRFREDPDAFLVMSLEDYDDTTGRAGKAPILRQDVVGPARPVTAVRSAEEGLLVSLNERGKVDLGHIAGLYGQDAEQIMRELGDHVYVDPVTREVVTRDAYLSGNVRQKLAVAEQAASGDYRRNIEALRAVQPEDLLPGEIDANLGAPWIPASIIRAFAADLFNVGPSSITVAHLAKDALWSIEGDYSAKASVANTGEFGTRRLDGLSLLEQALNLRTPIAYDEIKTGSESKRVLNQEETVAAREKQKRIKERFAQWVFAEPSRAETLVRLYNDTFNNLRLREYDGSHLTFPGMNQAIALRPHQTAAVWRNMTAGNTLLAHVVGAGKTFTMAATGMKMRQTGLVRKPMYVVPNHMLEQFGREFLQLYPNARLLIAGKEDLARDRRKLLVGKIATGDWDGIVVTHSSFERIGMSQAYQARFLRGQIADYETLLTDAKREGNAGESRAHRNLLKSIEKRKAAFEEKLKDLTAQTKKDDGLVFDELGVDQVFVDEAHYFKNLETPTKMDRVAGIQTQGSQRAFDLFMKAQYLDEQHPGRGVTFATGTPISNTMVEMYTSMRYLAPSLLKERGIDHFDAWAASFGEIVDTMEISPDGASLRPNSRFAKFTNLPELQQLFRSFADVQTADMLRLPVPALKGGKATIVSCPMSETQRAIQHDLVARYERIRRGGVDPREDNALAITTDGRKLALDARLVDPSAADWPDAKLHALVTNVAAVWRKTAAQRGTQLVFCDMGVNPTSWGFSVYDDIKRKLVDGGIPAEQIADIGDAATDAKKEALFDKVRSGKVRVLLGSTAKMGTGTNVQDRLVALHHVDAPWKPAEIEQRDGRILRQGNMSPEVEIFRYVTEGSFDAYMWQTLENKARFITQVMKGGTGVRRAEDIGAQELSFAEVKAIASGNPAVLTLAEIDADLQKLTLLKRAHADDQYRARLQVRALPEDLARLERRIGGLEADHATASRDHAAAAEIAGRSYPDREKAAQALNISLKHHLVQTRGETVTTSLGTYRGLRLALSTRAGAHPELIVSGQSTHFLEFRGIAAGGLLNRVDHLIERLPDEAAAAREQHAVKTRQLTAQERRTGQAFEHEGRLLQLQRLRHELETLLSSPNPADDTRARIDALVAEFKTLQTTQAPAPTSAALEPATVPATVTRPVAPPATRVTTLLPDAPIILPPEHARRSSISPRPSPAPISQPRHQGSLFETPCATTPRARPAAAAARTSRRTDEQPARRQLRLF